MTIDQPLIAGPGDGTPSSGPTPPSPVPGPRARTWLVGGGLAVAGATLAALLVWLPWGARNAFDHASIQPIRDTAWLGMTLDGLAMGVLAVTVSIATCLLAPDRGRRWADVGSVLTVLGGIAFAMSAFGRGVLGWFATAESVGPAAGDALLTLVSEDPTRLVLVTGGGFLSVTIGTLILAVAWWRSRVVPRWLPITLAVLTVAQFTFFEGRALDVVQILLMLSFVAFAVVFLRRRHTLS